MIGSFLTKGKFFKYTGPARTWAYAIPEPETMCMSLGVIRLDDTQGVLMYIDSAGLIRNHPFDFSSSMSKTPHSHFSLIEV